ncbi:MAG: GGDEF domain-containing protein [Terracidiphilus sp.]
MAAAIVFGLAWAMWPATLTNLRAIHGLSRAQANKNLPVAFEATVTYAHANQFFFFVEDQGAGIFVVRGRVDTKLSAGDRVLVRGRTALGVQPFVNCEAIRLLGHGSLPAPSPANLDELTRLKFDALRVKVKGVIQTVDPPREPGGTTYLQLATGGGFIDAIADSNLVNERDKLLGSEVEVSGVAAERLDDKFRQIGIQVFVPANDDIKILRQASAAERNAAGALTTLHSALLSIHGLSADEINKIPPVAFEATVNHVAPDGSGMFVQDEDIGLSVWGRFDPNLAVGDRVLVRGRMGRGFRLSMTGDSVTFLHHGDLPKPVTADFDELMQGQHDCVRVTVRGVIQAADLAWGADGPTFLHLRTNKGSIDAFLDGSNAQARSEMLDAEVDVTGIATIKLDGKNQEAGVLLLVSSPNDVSILKRAAISPRSLPVTPLDEVVPTIQVNDLTPRVHVRGSITYYQPGSGAVLQGEAGSLWVMSRSQVSLRIGDRADATGFPTLHDGFPTLADGEIQDQLVQAPIRPTSVSWEDLSSSQHNFDLVTLEGEVVTDIRENSHDEYVLVSGGNLFSAIYRHPNAASHLPLPAMRNIPLGSRVRVTGICMLKDSNPFNGPVPFDILLRGADDITVIARPSWMSVVNLMRIVSLLLLAVLFVGGWGWMLKKKVRNQTGTLATMAQFEQQRSRILEDINGSRPLVEILEEIVKLVSFNLEGAPCWCEIADGVLLGDCPPTPHDRRVVSAPILARFGDVLGTLAAAFAPETVADDREGAALDNGARLATLAIETRRLNADLRHRSEFDRLTEVHNRFSLEKCLAEQIEKSRDDAGIFGLIYVDLDEFKPVNDIYGHRVGDLYLHETAQRMKQQLRPHDLLARLGGDEFAVLLPMVRNRAGVEEIAQRLEHCFDMPLVLEGNILQGSASFGIALYPEDSATTDGILSAADAAMYVMKKEKKLRKEAGVGQEARDLTTAERA